MIIFIFDIRNQDGLVYAVEFSHRSGRDLINVAKKRTNIIPIIEDARHPHKYRMLLGKYFFSFFTLWVVFIAKKRSNKKSKKLVKNFRSRVIIHFTSSQSNECEILIYFNFIMYRAITIRRVCLTFLWCFFTQSGLV